MELHAVLPLGLESFANQVSLDWASSVTCILDCCLASFAAIRVCSFHSSDRLAAKVSTANRGARVKKKTNNIHMTRHKPHHHHPTITILAHATKMIHMFTFNININFNILCCACLVATDASTASFRFSLRYV